MENKMITKTVVSWMEKHPMILALFISALVAFLFVAGTAAVRTGINAKAYNADRVVIQR